METEDGVLPHDAVVDLAGSIDGDVIKDDDEEACLQPCSASRMEIDVRVLAPEDRGLREDGAYHLGRGHDRRASG